MCDTRDRVLQQSYRRYGERGSFCNFIVPSFLALAVHALAFRDRSLIQKGVMRTSEVRENLVYEKVEDVSSLRVSN